MLIINIVVYTIIFYKNQNRNLLYILYPISHFHHSCSAQPPMYQKNKTPISKKNQYPISNTQTLHMYTLTFNIISNIDKMFIKTDSPPYFSLSSPSPLYLFNISNIES